MAERKRKAKNPAATTVVLTAPDAVEVGPPPLSPRNSRMLPQNIDSWLREIGNDTMVVLGILSAGMGIHGFLESSHFIDGGVTGISMLVSNLTGWPLPFLIFVINAPFIYLAYRQVGREFAIRSALAIAGLSICLATLHFKNVTDDNILTAVFGGFFIGAGIGLAIRGGAVLDGTEIAALLISKRSGMLRVGDVILGMNIIIFITAAWFLGSDKAMYSILTYVSASKTLDFLIHGIEEYTAITIISSSSEPIRLAITTKLGRGVTIYKGKGGHTGADQDILMCVVTRLEIGKVRSITQEIDPSAFVMINPLADVKGGITKRGVVH